MSKYNLFRSIIKYLDNCLDTQIVIKKIIFFSIQYKNEWNGHKFWWGKNQKEEFL